jgi:hypothetical protein
MVREVDLISHLPLFLQEYREFQGIAKAENPEFQAVCDASETVKDNIFVLHTNEIGIARYEKMFGLQPSANDSLQNRQAKVLERYTNTVTYTMRGFVERLNAICGVGNYTVELIPDEYKIIVTLELVVAKLVNTISSMLGDMLPANMICEYRVNYNTHGQIAVYDHQTLGGVSHNEMKTEPLEELFSS